MEEWQAKDPRIKPIFLDKNSGAPAHPKNVAMQRSSGKLVAFLDSDDEWLPEKLEKQIAVFEKEPDVGLVSCEPFTVDSRGAILGREVIPDIPMKGLFPSILRTNFIFSESSIVIPRSVIDQVGPRDENPEIGIAEERENELRIAAAGYKFYVIHEPLFKYYVHESNMTIEGISRNRFHYAMADFKHIALFKKYKMEWWAYKSVAWGYYKLGDRQNARKYRKLALLSRPYDPRLIAGYLFMNMGNTGELLLTRGVRLWHQIGYLFKRNSGWKKKMDPHVHSDVRK